MKAVSYARKAYAFMKIGIKNTERQPEFLYSSGIYNYYRVAYPELHPIIKPLMVFSRREIKNGISNARGRDAENHFCSE